MAPIGPGQPVVPAPVDDGKGIFEHGQPNTPGVPVTEPTQPVGRLPGQPIDVAALQAEIEAKILANLAVGLAGFINQDWLAKQTGPSADALRLLVASQASLPHIQP